LTLAEGEQLSMGAAELPALLGGPPVRPQGPPDWPTADPAVLEALRAAHADGWWGRYDGGGVRRLEERLAAEHGVAFALACGSGTFAVELALRALRVGPGDEVALAAYDYPGNFLSVHAVGALPALVDLDPDNWNLAPDRLEEALGPRVKAAIVSHLHGGLAPMREITEIAQRHGITVVEDAAQATGATVQGRRAGAWGDVGVLSFGGSKLLSAGRGGALLTARADVHQRARLALTRAGNVVCPLSELQAAVLMPQLDRLAERHARRAAAVVRLTAALDGAAGLSAFRNKAEGDPAYYKVGFRLDEAALGLSRARLVAALRAEGIAFDEGFRALHVGRSPGRFRAAGGLAVAERAHRGAVVLHHPVLLGDDADLDQVAAAVGKVAAHVEPLRGEDDGRPA
jgi:dTDP-4-amino-4,6-dideoxygalactose transaminase